MQILHSGQRAKNAGCPENHFCMQARLEAKFAPQENAISARLMSAKFARDSILTT
jgi:hypothetical protein